MTIDIATVLNGNILSSKSCQFFVDMIPRKGIVACNYKEKLDAENVYDDDRTGTPVGSTSGRYSVESFSLTLLRASWNSVGPIPGLMQQLALKGLGSFGAARFAFIAEYSEPLVPLSTVVDSLFFCRITGVEDDYSEDIKALVTKLDLMCLAMTRNGVSLFDPKRALPL
jgi:hypothetical protein